MEVKTETLHGRSVSYAEAGEGPVLLLIHGMGGNFENWQEVIEPLATMQQSRRDAVSAKAAATRVQFFAMRNMRS